MEVATTTDLSNESKSTEQEDLMMLREDVSTPGMDYIWYDCLGD